ncbi:hypothetical protein DSL72_005404 [Monilinia vaccinii-corymbosi]|uniref:Uncharacterized protein n=1 Tax=Monilinia vaccinii-corymbosi TaxID=61207 RepID=A0A8A3PF24_9HELO|nr:hypothetical protein DSL72_005404 [Monilinia vaccinii-corymbosi]
MPLMKKLFPSMGLETERRNSRVSKAQIFSNFERDEDDSNFDSDMEASVMDKQKPKKRLSLLKAPAIPLRNSRRTSTIVHSVMPTLKSMDGLETTKELVKEEATEISNPHELYLSSEEDASLSDTDSLEVAPLSECNASRSSFRASTEDTARVVSLTLLRPRVIEIPRPTSLHSDLTSRNVSPVPDYQIRHTVADIGSLGPISSPHPPRQSSRLSSPPRPSTRRLSISSLGAMSKLNTSHPNASSMTLPQEPSKLSSCTSFLQPAPIDPSPSPRHAFLFSDPFPSPIPSPLSENLPGFFEPEQTLNSRRPKSMQTERPKTPTSLMEGLQGLTRTFSRSAKKRPSMPKLNIACAPSPVSTAHSNTSRSSLGPSNASKASLLPAEERTPKENKARNMRRSSTVPLLVHEERANKSQETQSAVDEKSPVRYDDIMRSVIHEPPPRTPSTPQSTSSPGLKGWMGMGMGNRRKSMKK